MITNHATDAEIQGYVLGETFADENIAIHIAGCENCIAKAANYQLLSISISGQPNATFDFDVANAVLSQLPAPRKAIWQRDAFIYSIACAAFSGLIVLGWVMRKDLAVIFDASKSAALYVLAAFVAGIVLWLCYDMLGRYQKQMAALQ